MGRPSNIPNTIGRGITHKMHCPCCMNLPGCMSNEQNSILIDILIYLEIYHILIYLEIYHILIYLDVC